MCRKQNRNNSTDTSSTFYDIKHSFELGLITTISAKQISSLLIFVISWLPPGSLAAASDPPVLSDAGQAECVVAGEADGPGESPQTDAAVRDPRHTWGESHQSQRERGC